MVISLSSTTKRLWIYARSSASRTPRHPIRVACRTMLSRTITRAPYQPNSIMANRMSSSTGSTAIKLMYIAPCAFFNQASPPRLLSKQAAIHSGSYRERGQDSLGRGPGHACIYNNFSASNFHGISISFLAAISLSILVSLYPL